MELFVLDGGPGTDALICFIVWENGKGRSDLAQGWAHSKCSDSARWWGSVKQQVERVDGASQSYPGCPLNKEASRSFEDTFRTIISLLPASAVGYREHGHSFWAQPGSVTSQLCHLGARHSAMKWRKSIPVLSAAELTKGPKEVIGTKRTLEMAMCWPNAMTVMDPVLLLWG